jgi:SAM-dependent methyltransferase
VRISTSSVSAPRHIARPAPDPRRIGDALRRGTLVDDRVFDDVFPLDVRLRSAVYWTPVEVAVRAAKLLTERPGATILDVGAGVGKFCIVAAAVVDADVRGIEHRPHLVQIARDAAAKIGVTPSFDHGTTADHDVARVDGFYFFNPFAENLCPGVDRLDATVELGETRFWRDLGATQEMLSRARIGARVVTFCGLGGELPSTFELAERERCGGGPLELWIKTREATEAEARAAR